MIKLARTPPEVKEIVCDIIRHYQKNSPSDSVTPTICISAIPGYKKKAKTLLKSLRQHQQNIPGIIAGSKVTKQITGQIVRTGSQIRKNMKEFVEEFLQKECSSTSG